MVEMVAEKKEEVEVVEMVAEEKEEVVEETVVVVGEEIEGSRK